ncbi:unnamed protein product [Closterium sp. Naga37s-1]|nr:unnamed protein product [Closterium sp. Naga37s-1]
MLPSKPAPIQACSHPSQIPPKPAPIQACSHPSLLPSKPAPIRACFRLNRLTWHLVTFHTNVAPCLPPPLPPSLLCSLRRSLFTPHPPSFPPILTLSFSPSFPPIHQLSLPFSLFPSLPLFPPSLSSCHHFSPQLLSTAPSHQIPLPLLHIRAPTPIPFAARLHRFPSLPPFTSSFTSPFPSSLPLFPSPLPFPCSHPLPSLFPSPPHFPSSLPLLPSPPPFTSSLLPSAIHRIPKNYANSPFF